MRRNGKCTSNFLIPENFYLALLPPSLCSHFLFLQITSSLNSSPHFCSASFSPALSEISTENFAVENSLEAKCPAAPQDARPVVSARSGVSLAAYVRPNSPDPCSLPAVRVNSIYGAHILCQALGQRFFMNYLNWSWKPLSTGSQYCHSHFTGGQTEAQGSISPMKIQPVSHKLILESRPSVIFKVAVIQF